MAIETLKPGELQILPQLENPDGGEPLGPLQEGLLRDLNGRLPHGVLRGPGERTPYTLHAPTLGVRRRIGDVEARKDLQDWPGRAVVYMLAQALHTLDGDVVSVHRRDGATVYGGDGKATEADVALRIASLTCGDVLALLLAWKGRQHKSGLEFNAGECDNCPTSLQTVRVDVGGDVPTQHVRPEISTTNPPRARLGLLEPIVLEDGREVRTLELAPPTWLSTFWHVKGVDFRNPTRLQIAQVVGAVVGTDLDGLSRITAADVEQAMLPEDVEAVDAALDRITPTVRMEVEVACPRCKHRNVRDLNWLELGFFGQR